MIYYSFENLDIGSDGKYNLFKKSVVNRQNLTFRTTVVNEEFKGRADLLCSHIHGSTKYIEEFLVLNNIINPYSIKPGMTVKYLNNPNDYYLLHDSDPEETNVKDEILQMNKNKYFRRDSNRIGSPPTIKPDSLKQLDINYSKKKITILNKFN